MAPVMEAVCDLELFERIAAGCSGLGAEIAELRRRLQSDRVPVTFEWNKAGADSVSVGGQSFPWLRLSPFGRGRFGGTIALEPGLHKYRWQVGGLSVHDPNRPWCHDGDGVVNWMQVNPPELPLDQRPTYRAWRSAIAPLIEDLRSWRGILGAVPEPGLSGGVTFGVWAPTAGRVSLVLNVTATGAVSKETRTIPMRRNPFGVWSTIRCFGYARGRASTCGRCRCARRRGADAAVHVSARRRGAAARSGFAVAARGCLWPICRCEPCNFRMARPDLDRYVRSSILVRTPGSWYAESAGLAQHEVTAIYELHVGCFSHQGGFKGVCEKLDHLAACNVNVIQLLPAADFAGSRNWGLAPPLRHAGAGVPGCVGLSWSAAWGRCPARRCDAVYVHSRINKHVSACLHARTHAHVSLPAWQATWQAWSQVRRRVSLCSAPMLRHTGRASNACRRGSPSKHGRGARCRVQPLWA